MVFDANLTSQNYIFLSFILIYKKIVNDDENENIALGGAFSIDFTN